MRGESAVVAATGDVPPIGRTMLVTASADITHMRRASDVGMLFSTKSRTGSIRVCVTSLPLATRTLSARSNAIDEGAHSRPYGPHRQAKPVKDKHLAAASKNLRRDR